MMRVDHFLKYAKEHFERLLIKRFLPEKWVNGVSYCVLFVVTKQNESKVNKLYCEDTLATCLSQYTKADP